MSKTPEDFVRWSAATTMVHAVATVVSLAGGDNLRVTLVTVFAGLFLAGIAGCFVAFVIAIGRSRYEEVFLAGAFFLAGGVIESGPRRRLYALLLVQVIVGVAGASLAPFTPVTFSVLSPLSGLAFVALSGSHCGQFMMKSDDLD